MAIAQLGYHGLEGIEHVKISAGIKIGCGESGSGVEYEQIADSCRLRGILVEKSFYSFSDIEDLASLSGFDCDPLHDTVGLMAAADVPPRRGSFISCVGPTVLGLVLHTTSFAALPPNISRKDRANDWRSPPAWMRPPSPESRRRKNL